MDTEQSSSSQNRQPSINANYHSTPTLPSLNSRRPFSYAVLRVINQQRAARRQQRQPIEFENTPEVNDFIRGYQTPEPSQPISQHRNIDDSVIDITDSSPIRNMEVDTAPHQLDQQSSGASNKGASRGKNDNHQDMQYLQSHGVAKILTGYMFTYMVFHNKLDVSATLARPWQFMYEDVYSKWESSLTEEKQTTIPQSKPQIFISKPTLRSMNVLHFSDETSQVPIKANWVWCTHGKYYNKVWDYVKQRYDSMRLKNF